MKTKSLIIALLTLITANAGAVEIKDTVKGNFRNMYPDAVFVSSTMVNASLQSNKTFSTTTNSVTTDFDEEKVRTKNGFKELATKVCSGKSQYGIVENYEIHATLGESTVLFITTDANIVCFNLPK